MGRRKLDVSIWRGDIDGGDYQKFAVPREDNQTVLDVVTWVQQHADPTLSYRFACRVGMCGSCAMMVNGVPRWTCRTHVRVASGDDTVRIAPLRNLPVIRDLVTDMDPFFDAWNGAEGHHHPTRSRDGPVATIPPNSIERQRADAGIECINCAICYAACDTVAAQPDYLGPAALQRAWTILNDTRDGAGDVVLDAVSGGNGCFNCHSIGSCAAYCPNALNPLDAIAGLKRAAARSRLRRRR